MSEDKTYILKQPAKAELNDLDLYKIWFKNEYDEYFVGDLMDKEKFETCFVEFDVDATRKQIEEEARKLLKGRVLLTSPFSDGGFNPSKEEIEQIDTDDILKFVDRVLGLITGEK